MGPPLRRLWISEGMWKLIARTTCPLCRWRSVETTPYWSMAILPVLRRQVWVASARGHEFCRLPDPGVERDRVEVGARAVVGIRSAQWSGSAARIALRVPPRSWKPMTLGRASRITSLMSWATAAGLMVFFRLSEATRKPGALDPCFDGRGRRGGACAGCAAGAGGAATSAALASSVVRSADRRI